MLNSELDTTLSLVFCSSLKDEFLHTLRLKFSSVYFSSSLATVR